MGAKKNKSRSKFMYTSSISPRSSSPTTVACEVSALGGREWWGPGPGPHRLGKTRRKAPRTRGQWDSMGSLRCTGWLKRSDSPISYPVLHTVSRTTLHWPKSSQLSLCVMNTRSWLVPHRVHCFWGHTMNAMPLLSVNIMRKSVPLHVRMRTCGSLAAISARELDIELWLPKAVWSCGTALHWTWRMNEVLGHDAI